LGLLTTFQLLPFHCSVSVSWRPAVVKKKPTAQMSLAETTATEFNWFVEVPGLGLETTLQLVPFQCRVSVCKTPLLELSAYPTAQMSLAEATATEFNWFLNVPGLGLETTLQLVPFQCSISVWLSLLAYPTAQTSLAETAATSFRTSSDPTLGLETTLQLVPFQCSISVCTLSVPPMDIRVCPTAQMSLDDTTATALRELLKVPTLGLETTFQLVPFHCSVRV
jgi:hypothetical protein